MERTRQHSRLGKVTVEDLLKALDNPEETTKEAEVNQGKNDVLSFVMAYGITPGNHLVTGKLLYELYKSWTSEPIGRGSFNFELGKYLSNINGYYCIDRPSFKVSEEIHSFLVKKTRSVTKSKSHKKHFENYLRKYLITPGNFYLESYVLYHLYDKWTYGIKKKQPLGYHQFISLCKLYLKYKRNSKSRVMWFGVNRDSILKTITVNQIFNIRKGRKMRYGKDKSKKRQEIPRS